MSGCYLRVERNGLFESIEVEYLSNEERERLLADRTPKELIRWLNAVCNCFVPIKMSSHGKER